jgi:hypothetical protein
LSFSLVVDTAAAALAEQRPKPVSSRPLLTSPNPTRGPATITYSLPAPGRIRLAIYDAAGRLVRVVADRTVSAGAHQQLWDGRNAVGRPVGAGIYVARLSGAAETRSTRLVLVR